jgi:DNA-binding NtrC family response regulator
MENVHPAIAPQRILVIDDGADARTSMQQMLALSLKLEVDTAVDGNEALKKLTERPYSIAITDLRMPKLSGMQLIAEIEKRKLPVTVIVTTAHGTIADAVKAMQQGAYDFLTKPVDPQYLTVLVQRALRGRALEDEVVALRQRLVENYSFADVLSKSPSMHDVFDVVRQLSDTMATVLIAGETGTGKEMIAKALHQTSSALRPGPFVPVNCAALPETLMESELFGHEKGSFTGAAGQRRGRFEQANKGTLFLDEVGDIPMSMQVKLLRVIQERRIERVGGIDAIDIDVRLVAATNRSLEKMVADGKFREDLYYRLNVVKIDLPPLRERREDIPILSAHFAAKYVRTGRTPPEFSPEAMERLLHYHWPGNVRQLENAVERACVTVRHGTIESGDLPADISGRPATGDDPKIDLNRPLPQLIAEASATLEERYLRLAMQKTRGHVGKCAELIGLSRRSVTDKLSQYNIDKSEFKDEAGGDDS